MNSGIFPIQIDKFAFAHDRFMLNAKEYTYESIESLKFVISNVTINFSTEETYIMSIRLNDDTIYAILVGDPIFSFNKKKVAAKKSNLRTVFNHINEFTYEPRVNRYLSQLKAGCVYYKFPGWTGSNVRTVRIHGNGDVVMDNVVFNLKRARETGTLKFGTAYGLGCDRSVDPYEISINEKKPLFGGWMEGSGSMRIDGGWDYPIIVEMLKSLSS